MRGAMPPKPASSTDLGVFRMVGFEVQEKTCETVCSQGRGTYRRTNSGLIAAHQKPECDCDAARKERLSFENGERELTENLAALSEKSSQ